MQAFLCLLGGWVLLGATVAAQEINPTIKVEERTTPGDLLKRYFLIRHQESPTGIFRPSGLLLILPGGDGGKEFMPFCANVITALGVPRDFLVAELVAPGWNPADAQRIVWPCQAFPYPEARFTTEEFMAAVIADVAQAYPLPEGQVFALGWSSSGPAVYSASWENPKIRGAFLAMSRCRPEWFAHAEAARGKRYYFWHSPADAICPYAESQDAAARLERLGALTVLKSYPGGHGWQPRTFYADRIREAIEWFRASESDARKMQTDMRAANALEPLPTP